jgi:beta-glucanase (GH16 family)
MKKNNLTILSLFALLITISCTSDQKIMSVGERIEQIIAESDNPAEGGTPSLGSLAEAGIKNADGSQTAYEKAIAIATPAPTTLTEMQNIINNVNDNVNLIEGNNTLVWSDEFNVDGAPNNSNWGYDIGAGGWGNGEAQYYTQREDNVIVEDGLLKIIARKESYEGSSYTSSRLKSQGKYSFTYGKVEVRAKLPASAGTWPAIWMLGANFSSVGWPACGEIDIMEQKGWEKGKISSSLHNLSSSGNTENVAKTDVPNSTSEFHVYAMNWTAERIEFSVDGDVFYSYGPATKNNQNWPYTASQFIILNVAMGGDLGGDIPSDFTENKMEIDYVRVYR